MDLMQVLLKDPMIQMVLQMDLVHQTEILVSYFVKMFLQVRAVGKIVVVL